MAGAAAEIGVGVVGIDAEVAGGVGHELGESDGSDGGAGLGAKAAFGLDESGEEVRVDAFGAGDGSGQVSPGRGGGRRGSG